MVGKPQVEFTVNLLLLKGLIKLVYTNKGKREHITGENNMNSVRRKIVSISMNGIGVTSRVDSSGGILFLYMHLKEKRKEKINK